jgi:hypothetical protein
MSDTFNKAVEEADKLYSKYEKLPFAEQIALAVTPGIGEGISAYETPIYAKKTKEAFQEGDYLKAGGQGILTGLSALGAIPLAGMAVRGGKAAVKAALKGVDEIDLSSVLKSNESLEQYAKQWKDDNRLPKSQRQKQNPKVKEAAEQFEEGKLTGKEFRAITKAELPIKPIDDMIDVPEFDEIVGALEKGKIDVTNPAKGIIGLTKEIEDGKRLATRLDIPAYENFNKWIVSIHEGLKGSSIGYGKSARLRNVVFGSSPRTALDIAQKKLKPDVKKIRAAKKAFEKKYKRTPNKKELDEIRKDPKNFKAQAKSTIARMEGDWTKKYKTQKEVDEDNVNIARRLLENKKNGKYFDEAGEEWIQVGMNPYRASYFYDKATGQALQAADEVIQVGPLVFAKNALRIDSSRVKEAIKSFEKRSGRKLDPKNKDDIKIINQIRIDAKKPTLSEYKKGFTVQTQKSKKAFESAIKSFEKRLGRKLNPKNKDDIKIINQLKKSKKVFKHGGKIMAGGLSNLKKSININGQPHSLAWINPDEASALRAMGGSGKKGPMGIPSYQTDEDYSWDWGPTGGYQYGEAEGFTGDDTIPDTGYNVPDYTLADRAAVLNTTVRGLGPIGTEGKTVDDDTPTDMRKGILGLYGDQMTRGEVLDKAKNLGYTTWRNTAGRYSLDPEKDYDTWFAAQDPTALIAGFQVGDPVGMAMQQSFDIINTQLANKFKTAREEMESISGEKELSEGTIKNLAKEAGVKDFKSYSGIDYPWYMPGGILAKGLNFLSSNVVGTGTVGGVGVHVNKDGTVTPISPEDSPGFDHESMRGENVEAPIRRRIPQQKVSVSESITEEEPLTGMKGLLARRSKPSTRIQSNTFLSNLLDDIYGSDREKLLG